MLPAFALGTPFPVCYRGKLTLINHFSDFTDFLATVKDLNPSIEIKGF
jgi:hypothetical protein